MQTAEKTSQRERRQPAALDNVQQAPLVAVGAVLLQPRSRIAPAGTIVDRGSWPIFVIVLDDRAAADRRAEPLFHLLDQPHVNRIPMAHSHYRWSMSRSGAMLKLALRSHEPTWNDLDIVMPAQPLLGVLSRLPANATFAITTERHADKLTERVHVRDALHEMVLLVSQGNRDDGLAELRNSGETEGPEPQPHSPETMSPSANLTG
jgi:hypothetical protein